MSHSSEYLEQIRNELGDSWLPQLYADQVLKLHTRAYEFPALPTNAQIEIHHTLLGIEVKAGHQRMLCPDLATARSALNHSRKRVLACRFAPQDCVLILRASRGLPASRTTPDLPSV